MSLPRIALLVGLAAAVLAVAALAAGGDRERAPRTAIPRVGIVGNALDLGPGAGDELDRARSTGARWVREELRWDAVEPQPGARRWEAFDALLAAAAERGLRVLPLLLRTPAWVADDPLTVPEDPAPFAAFAERAAARYGPGGTFWRARPELDGRLAPRVFEVWNEPYLAKFSTGGPDPARYARLVRAAGPALRRGNPQARALAAMEATYLAADGTERSWVDDVHAAVPDLGRYYAAAAVHPYGTGSPTAERPGRRWDSVLRLRDVRARLDEVDDSAKRLWLTEIGWSTCRLRPRCVGRRVQALHLRQLFEVLDAEPRGTIEAVFLYSLRDLEGSPGDPENRFGLFTFDGRGKPALAVLQDVTRGR